MQDGRRTMNAGEDKICNMTAEQLLAFLNNPDNSIPDRKKAAQRLIQSFRYTQPNLEHTLGEDQAYVIFGGKKKKKPKTTPQRELRRGGGRLF